MVQVGKDITWQDSLILENEVSVLNNVLYADLTGVFLVVGCTLFISLVNCLSEIPNSIAIYDTMNIRDYDDDHFEDYP